MKKIVMLILFMSCFSFSSVPNENSAKIEAVTVVNSNDLINEITTTAIANHYQVFAKIVANFGDPCNCDSAFNDCLGPLGIPVARCFRDYIACVLDCIWPF